ncbi:hypothetical protein P171DRAFT_503148, partial [Karstenula rhodostoma CBS 690.94]
SNEHIKSGDISLLATVSTTLEPSTHQRHYSLPDIARLAIPAVTFAQICSSLACPGHTKNMSPQPQESEQPAAPMSDLSSDPKEFRVCANQEGNGSTMIANNGYGKYIGTKGIYLDANQNGNSSYMSANNADNRNEEGQIQKHNEGIAIRKELQAETGQVLGGEAVTRLNLSQHRAEMFEKMQQYST